MKKIDLLLMSLLLVVQLKAQNPISPPGIYIADPSARVWNDGKLYVYGSVDESVDYWCSHTHHALSTEDMLNWTLHKDYYQSKGTGDKIPYTDNVLYAPDAIYKDGKYYLYYCISHPTQPEGVAVSDHPINGFSDGQVIDLHGYEQIDPAAFIDDDGTSYYLWGQFTLKMARLNDDMLSIDPASIQDSVLTEGRDNFHEGVYMTKRNGIYYLVYAHLDKAHRPTQLGYATSTNPMGPYKYGGVIIDNDHSDPEVWNNHGSMIEYKGQWYIFYHRSSHGTVRMRKACVEPIFFNEDGSIDEVEMTTQGAGPPLDPFKKTDAERACTLHGNVRIVAEGKSNEILTGINFSDRAVYKYLQFSGSEKSLKVRAKAKGSGGKIVVSLDGPWNPPISTIDIPAGSNWTETSATIKVTSGKHAVWLVFLAKEEDDLSLDWFQFD